MRLRYLFLVILLLAVSLSSVTVSASLVQYLSPRQLGTYSDLVIRGTVEETESYWNDTHTKIITRIRIGVDETYKGAAAGMIEVLQLGGTVGNVRVTVHGSPVWNSGEEVLLFAEPHDGSHFRVTGLSQGKFRIERDPETGEPFVHAPRMESVQILGAPGGEDNGDQPGSAIRGVRLEEFISRALDRPEGEGVPR
jgi:hypothetical protein